MLILTRIRPELDGGIFTCPRRVWRLIGFCSAGDTGCAVIASVSYLVIVFRVKLFYGPPDCACLAIVIPGNRSSVHRLWWIVPFLILRGVQTAASVNLGDAAKLLPLGLVVLAMMMFKLDTFKLASPDLRRTVWERVKNTMLITCGFSLVWRCRGCFARARNKRDVGKRHCWQFSPLWAFIC